MLTLREYINGLMQERSNEKRPINMIQHTEASVWYEIILSIDPKIIGSVHEIYIIMIILV